MDYELKALEHIITIVLNPTKITRDNLNDEFLSECKLLAVKESERILKEFRVIAFGKYQQSELGFYYRKHQAILVKFADFVYGYLQPEGPESIYGLSTEPNVLDFYKEILRIPLDLLDYIETSYPEYFDQDIKLPEAKRWQKATEIKRILKGIQKEMEKLEIDGELIKIACRPFEDYLLPDLVISYHKLSYVQVLQGELITHSKKKAMANSNDELCRLLLQLNYNSIHFFNYYVLQLQEKANDHTMLTDLFTFHSLKLKIINQLPVKPGLAYKPGLPSIRDQIGSWICEELYYLEKQEQVLQQWENVKKEDRSNESRIHTSLSVSQLALAVKLLVESKVISNTNSAELMRLVARNFRTDRQEVISEDSLRNKSYSFESSTINRLKDEIIGLMNLVRKY